MAESGKFYGLIPAGGVGNRFGGPVPKQYARLGDRTLLEWSVDALLADQRVQKVFVVVSDSDEYADSLLKDHSKVEIVRKAGKERVNTVLNALNYLLESFTVSETDWVLVHDAARPGLELHSLSRLISEASEHVVGGLLALPLADTLKKAEKADSGEVLSRQTVSREGMWAAQTPQMFRAQALSLALAECLFKQVKVTDEASAIETMGMSPLLIKGSLRNLKVTEAADLPAVASLMGVERGR